MTNDEKSFERWNRLFAEKVMGWKLYHLGDGVGMWGVPEKASYIEVKGDPDKFTPCTSIADAWMGVEKMIEDGCDAELRVETNEDSETFYSFSICGVAYERFWEDTAPLAITKACLLAKGVGV